MKRWLAVAIVALMLAVPAASAAGWLQPRGDAAATGFAAEGPAWKDVALDLELPKNIMPRYTADPLLMEDRVLVLTYGNYDAYNGSAQVRSVNLTTGETGIVAEVDVTGPMTMATDGGTLFIGGLRTVEAIPLGPGGAEWTWSWEPRTDAGRFEVGCLQMTVERGSVTVLCKEENARYNGPTQVSGRAVVLAARLDAEIGEEVWLREWPDPARQPTEVDDSPYNMVFSGWLAVSQSRAIVQTIHFAGSEGTGAGTTVASQPVGAGAGGGQGYIAVRSLDASNGERFWEWQSRKVNITGIYPAVGGATATENPNTLPLGNPVVAGDSVYVKALKARKLTLGSGEQLWERNIGEKDFAADEGGGTALAFMDGAVFTTTAQTTYKLDGDNPKRGWSQSLNFSDDQGFDQDPIVTPSHVYATTYRDDDPGSVYAFDADDGDIAWERQLDGRYVYSLAVADGRLAYTDTEFFDDHVETRLVVLGRTELSPEPEAEVSTVYPDVGEEVEVNLSGSVAGGQGSVTRYKAIWGDGNETDWRSEPVLEHTYDQPGEQTARFVVGNEANQTASATQTFHVGQEAPAEPNWLAQRFAKGNQDMTFGVLGLAVALGGGAIGVARRKRKKSLLEQELEALEQGFAETREQPSECEALLDNRKARARSLALDDKLDEEQVTIVESRAEELRGELRVSALEEEFAFLPYGLVTKARQMVEDGDVTSLEKDAFLRAVEEDEVLTEEQKATVRERIQRWHGRDVGGGQG